MYGGHTVCRVNVQVLGDSKNVKVEPRVLHLDLAATALQLVRKERDKRGGGGKGIRQAYTAFT
jgi:hypothetical protein